MEILQKISQKANDLLGVKPVTIAFLGDSVTQGCFECYFDEKGIQTVFDSKRAYPTRVKEILNFLYPSAQINIVNSGISGDNAVNGDKRFERDITPYHPDLVVVAFGLNDACQGVEKVQEYCQALKSIFNKIKALGAECIFVFQNMMNTRVSCHLKEEEEIKLAAFFAEIQTNGTMDCYYEAAKHLSKECGVAFCDMYHTWKRMFENGVDITELLSNKYNHPEREFHYYIATKLVEKMLEI